MTASASTTSGIAARQAALRSLRAVADGAYSNLVVPREVAGLGDARDRAFASHLAYDTLRWEKTLDWVLAQVVSRGVASIEPALLPVLRLGTLQLLLTDVPRHAAVDTSVELARASVPGRRADGAAGFVNGVLRTIARRADDGTGRLPRGDFDWPDADSEPTAHLALVTGHPRWVVEDLEARLAPTEVRAVLDADNDPPGLTLRAVGDRDALVGELTDAGFAASAGTLAPEAVRVPGGDPRDMPAVTEGRAVPQDEASMVVARATQVRAGDRVLDACAGPGGKATHLAQLVSPGGRCVAFEVNESRANLVHELAHRLGMNVDVVVADARHPPVRGGFDAVLVDAPCTGLGSGRRRPEIRWRRDRRDLIDLQRLQQTLLCALAPLVRPGGCLTYSVCTWTRAETVDVVEAVTHEIDFTLASSRQLWPHEDGTDGMYIATWRHGRGDDLAGDMSREHA